MTQSSYNRSPRWWDTPVSLVLWTLGILWIVLFFTLLLLLQTFISPDKLDWLSHLYARGQIALTFSPKRVFRSPKLDPKATYIFMQNHVNHLDYAVSYPATPHFKQGMELAKHFDYPFYGWVMKQRGGIGVKPRDPNRREDIKRQVKRETDKGRSVLAFPEGTRTRTGEVGPFKTGIFHIARDLGIPIVPIATIGSDWMMNALSHHLRPFGPIAVYVEDPIETAGLTDEEVDQLAETVRQKIIARIADHHRTSHKAST